MAIKIENRFVVEDITDEKGNKLGEVKFDPNDSRIMGKLAKIVDDLTNSLKEFNELGEMPNLDIKNLESVEDFEKCAEDIKKITTAISIEESGIVGVINDLSEVFGKDVIDIFTRGSENVYAIMPLIDFVMPYIEKSRKQNIDKYMPKSNADVME